MARQGLTSESRSGRDYQKMVDEVFWLIRSLLGHSSTNKLVKSLLSCFGVGLEGVSASTRDYASERNGRTEADDLRLEVKK